MINEQASLAIEELYQTRAREQTSIPSDDMIDICVFCPTHGYICGTTRIRSVIYIPSAGLAAGRVSLLYHLPK